MPSHPAFDMIAIGESLRDVFYTIHDATVNCSLKKDQCLICLEYAEKIPVQRVVKVPAAGNSANAAVGGSRLGLKTALVSWVGQDHAGRHLLEALDEEGVHLGYIETDRKHPTSEATIITFQGEKTQLAYYQPRIYKLPKLPSARCIYYSAMGAKHVSFDKMLLRELKKKPKTFFVFQPGTTHVKSELDVLKPLIARSDLFILNREEAHHLLQDGERTILNMLQQFHRHGAKKIVITDGGNGAASWDGTDYLVMPVFPTDIVETTGAGDAFSLGVTVALLNGEPLSEALRWGTANGWSVVQSVGPQKGLLTTSNMQRILKKFSKINSKRDGIL